MLTRFTPVGFGAIFVASQEHARAAVPATASLRDAAGDEKRPALVRWGTSARPGALRRLPAIWEGGVPHRAARRGPACASRLMGPGGPVCRHEMGQYQGGLV